MYGEDGWCRSCGTPLRNQSGPLVIQGSKFPTADVWMPNWLFDTVCISADIAEEVARDFRVDLVEVHNPRQGVTGVRQVRAGPTASPWYTKKHLSRAVRERHGQDYGRTTGSTCRSCGRWKWLPIAEDWAPVQASALTPDADVVASPEIFGDGLKSFRHLLFRRPLAELLHSKAKRNWDLRAVSLT